MKLKCPRCKEELNADFICKNAHQFETDEGVLKLMTPKFAFTLEDWLIHFEEFRKPDLRELDFDNLPQSGLKIDKNIWSSRQMDIKIISSLIDQNTKAVLDIGSWNGWMANYLSKKGLGVTAIDYFVDELDGMKAKKYYKNANWNSIQMNLEDLSILDDRFDLIVVNRCFPYFSDTAKMIESVIHLLAPKGKLIITGLNINKLEEETPEFKQANLDFESAHGRKLMFKPFKGYVSTNDLALIKKNGFKILPYPNLKNRIKEKLFKNRNVSYYGIYTNQL